MRKGGGELVSKESRSEKMSPQNNCVSAKGCSKKVKGARRDKFETNAGKFENRPLSRTWGIFKGWVMKGKDKHLEIQKKGNVDTFWEYDS